MSGILKNSIIFTAGIIATVAFFGFYWHSNKEELSQKVLGKVAQGNYCPDDSLDSSAKEVSTSEEAKIYFVGCGGFF